MRTGPTNYPCLKLSTTKPQKAQDKTSTSIARNKEKTRRVRFNPLCNCIKLFSMAAVIQPCPLISLFFVSLFSILHLSACQPNSPRNIETFYPFRPPPNPTNPIPNPRISQLSIPSSKSSSSYAVAKAVAATAATTIVVSGLFFILFQKYTVARGRSQKGKNDPRGGGENVVSHIEFSRFNGNLNGLIVDENGLDVLYWKKLEGDYRKNSFPKQALHNLKDEEKRMSRNGDGRAKSEPTRNSFATRKVFNFL